MIKKYIFNLILIIFFSLSLSGCLSIRGQEEKPVVMLKNENTNIQYSLTLASYNNIELTKKIRNKHMIVF